MFICQYTEKRFLASILTKTILTVERRSVSTSLKLHRECRLRLMQMDSTAYNTVYAVRFAHPNARLRLALRIHRNR